MHITNTSVANNYRLVHDASCINSKSQTRPGPRCIAECLFQGVAYRNVRRGEREWHRKGHAKCARANVKQSRRTARAPFDMSILRTGLVLALLALCAAAEPQRVLLRDVPSLAFESGRMTAGRRPAPVPQMAQTGG